MSTPVVISSVKLVNFKNHSLFEIDLSKGFNGICGLNGTGKTNLLDAIHYLTTGKSYFNFSDQQSVKLGETFLTITGLLKVGSEKYKMHISVETGKKKVLKLDEVPVRKLSEFIGKFSSVLIAPADIEFVTGGAEVRRLFVDRIICQHDFSYLDSLASYNKLLEQRNRALKKSENNNVDELLKIYSAQMKPYAEHIYATRSQFTEFIGKKVLDIYSFISQSAETISLQYCSQLNAADFTELTNKNLAKDKILERTTVGIHKDDLEFTFDYGFQLKKSGSQGQIKTWTIALKLAAMLWLMEKNNQIPVLLLDDIFEKIDETRLHRMLSWLSDNHKGQWLVTDAHLNRLEQMMENMKVEKKFFNIDAP